MQTLPGNLFTRPDTLFGVCEGIGQDFGFDPTLLRIALAASILWNPLYAFGAYFALGLLVLVSRLAFPNVRMTEVKSAIDEAAPAEAMTSAPQEFAEAA